MTETVLLYNFDGDKLSKIKRALLPLKLRIKTVSHREFLNPLGFLAGIKGFDAALEEYDGEAFSDEMILICPSKNGTVEAVIKALYKNSVGKIELKAMLTNNNVGWNSLELYKAVKADHEEMNKQSK